MKGREQGEPLRAPASGLEAACRPRHWEEPSRVAEQRKQRPACGVAGVCGAEMQTGGAALRALHGSAENPLESTHLCTCGIKFHKSRGKVSTNQGGETWLYTGIGVEPSEGSQLGSGLLLP